MNAGFLELFSDGLPPITPLVAGSDGPPSADPFGDLEDGGQQPWPECLRGDSAAGFSLVVYEGGGVDELEACARSADITALYALSEGEFVSYILGALRHELTGLTEGVEYDLQVRASNSTGTGPSSEVFSESTVATAPGACHHRLLTATIRASAIPNIQLYLVDLISDYTCDASTLRVWQAI